MTPTPSEQAAAVLNLIERGVIGWNEPEVVKVLNGALKLARRVKIASKEAIRRLKLVNKHHQPMTKSERDRVAKIRCDLAQEGITPERWELEALARGATVIYGDKNSNMRSWKSGLICW